MGARMLPFGQERARGSFHPMDFVGLALSAVAGFFKICWKPILVLAVISIGVGGIFSLIAWRKSVAIRNFAQPRALNSRTHSETVVVGIDKYGYAKTEYQDKTYIDCITDYKTLSAEVAGSSVAVKEIMVFEMGFDFRGDGYMRFRNLRVTANQIVFSFDENLKRPYVTFSGLNHWPTDDYFEELYSNEPTAKVIIHCRREHAPKVMLEATGLESESEKTNSQGK